MDSVRGRIADLRSLSSSVKRTRTAPRHVFLPSHAPSSLLSLGLTGVVREWRRRGLAGRLALSLASRFLPFFDAFPSKLCPPPLLPNPAAALTRLPSQSTATSSSPTSCTASSGIAPLSRFVPFLSFLHLENDELTFPRHRQFTRDDEQVLHAAAPLILPVTMDIVDGVYEVRLSLLSLSLFSAFCFPLECPMLTSAALVSTRSAPLPLQQHEASLPRTRDGLRG
jgi:hypothetical protein